MTKAEAKSKSQLCFSSVCATLMWAKATQDKPQTDNKQTRHTQGQTHTTRLTHTHWRQLHTQTDTQTLTQREIKNTHTPTQFVNVCIAGSANKAAASLKLPSLHFLYLPLPLPISLSLQSMRGLIPPHSSVICIS